MYIKSNINILVITDTFCKDSATTMPFLMKLSELNSKIHVNFLKKEGNEELLQELSGECRIPTIIKLDEKKQMKGKYIEFPQVVREKINGKNEEERKAIVEEVRSGKYNDEITMYADITFNYVKFYRVPSPLIFNFIHKTHEYNYGSICGELQNYSNITT